MGKNRKFVPYVVLIMLVIAALACNGGATTDPEPPDDSREQAVPPSSTPIEDEPEPTEVPPTATPEPTATPMPTPTPSPVHVLLVAENKQSGHLDWTSFDEILDALNSLDDVIYDTWTTYSDGYPVAGDLEDFDVVIWTAGDDCCDSPPIPSVDAMIEYLNGGGGLLMEGGSVVYPWDGSIWPTEYLGVQWLGYGPVGDMMVSEPEHPIAEGFPSGSIDLIVNGAVNPDTLDLTTGVAVFERGPRSSQRGQPLVVAHDGGHFRVVLSSVPLQWFSPPDRQLFLENALDWLRKTLDATA